MTGTLTHHDTLVFERAFDAPAAQLYAAFADPAARASWSAPSDTAIFIYDETDFRVGGRDFFRCGSRDDPRYRGEVCYHDIVAGRRIISTEIVYELDTRLSIAVVTLELEPERERTKLKLTVQLASLAGPGMIEGTKTGYAGALDNVERFLARDGEAGRPPD